MTQLDRVGGEEGESDAPAVQRGMIEIAPGSGVTVPLHVFTSANLAAKQRWEEAFRVLLRAVFPREVLGTHSCLGVHSKRPGLDPIKLGAVKSKCFTCLFHRND